MREWDAPAYDRLSDPQHRWGSQLVPRLELAGDERVLDAGCGTGRVTEVLLDRLPRGRVVALDVSTAMLAQARRRLAGHLNRVDFVLADLAVGVPVRRMDAILSTATFHWILDHDALFANLASALRPGGRLVAQCGGPGNLAEVRAILDDLGRPMNRVNFATPEETAARLEAAGFGEIEVWVHHEPTTLPPGEPFETFLRTVVLRHQLEGMDEPERADFVHEVMGRLSGPEILYVRLNIDARRAADV